MKRDFDIVDGIYLVQTQYELDLHNNYDFIRLDYSVELRSLLLSWRRSKGDWVAQDTPELLSVEFVGVSEFRFLPRDSEMPFTEDDCVNSFGYWVDEEWAEGVITVNSDQVPDEGWLTAVDFMSGSAIIVQAESAHASIKA